MRKGRDVSGLIPAVVMAYDNNGKVCENRLASLYEYLAGNGVDGLFIGGSTGEWPLLTASERKLAVEVAVSTVGNKIPIAFHASSMLIDEVIDYASFAEKLGVDAISIIMPYYFNFRPEGLYEYFASILRHVNIPVFIYNIPGNVKNILTPNLLLKLSNDFDCVIGVKDSSMDFLKLQEFMVEVKRPGFKYFTGNDAQIVPSAMWGATGAISAAAGAFPKYVSTMYRLACTGDIEKAHQMQEHIIRYRKMVVSNSPMSVVKAALEIAGYEVGVPRLPLIGLDPSKYGELEEIIKDGGLLE